MKESDYYPYYPGETAAVVVVKVGDDKTVESKGRFQLIFKNKLMDYLDPIVTLMDFNGFC